MNEDLNAMYEHFQRLLESHIQERWTITEEVTETGSLFTRARLKGHPLEVINYDRGQMELNLN